MSKTCAARSFPWGTLDSTTRDEAAALRCVRRWAGVSSHPAAVASSLQNILRAPVEILIRRAQPLATARALAQGVGVAIAPAESPGLSRAVLVETEGALAAAIAARAIDRAPPVVVDGASVPSVALAGALAAILLATARRARYGVAPRVVAAGPAEDLEADMARGEPDLLVVGLTVLVADDAFAARIVLPRAAAIACPPSEWSTRVLSGLGALPLSMPIVACSARVTATDLATLRPGDVFLPGGWPLARGESGALSGPILLAAPCSDIGVHAELGAGERLVLGGEVRTLCNAEAGMTEADEEGGGLLSAVGDIPVVVRVEIGEARMAAREWASLGRGDVVALGRRVGEHVVLRVGGIPVARGDLVDIDGEVGVRIVERLAGEPSTR